MSHNGGHDVWAPPPPGTAGPGSAPPRPATPGPRRSGRRPAPRLLRAGGAPASELVEVQIPGVAARRSGARNRRAFAGVSCSRQRGRRSARLAASEVLKKARLGGVASREQRRTGCRGRRSRPPPLRPRQVRQPQSKTSIEAGISHDERPRTCSALGKRWRRPTPGRRRCRSGPRRAGSLRRDSGPVSVPQAGEGHDCRAVGNEDERPLRRLGMERQRAHELVEQAGPLAEPRPAKPGSQAPSDGPPLSGTARPRQRTLEKLGPPRVNTHVRRRSSSEK